MATITAQNLLDENKYSTDDISLARAEELIDNAITYINLETGLSIAKMAGASGSKTLSVTDNQYPIVKALASVYIRGYVDGDPTVRLDGQESGAPPPDQHVEYLKGVVSRGIILLRALRRKGAT